MSQPITDRERVEAITECIVERRSIGLYSRLSARRARYKFEAMVHGWVMERRERFRVEGDVHAEQVGLLDWSAGHGRLGPFWTWEAGPFDITSGSRAIMGLTTPFMGAAIDRLMR